MAAKPPVTRLHIDTDFAGDPDDACALAMVLGWPGVEVVAVTTTADPDGQRAGYLAHVLAMLGRSDIPVEVGAGHSGTTGRPMGGIPDHLRFWGTAEVPPPRPTSPGAAVEMLDHSIGLGATVVAIGPFTNLALLEAARPGRLADARVVVMGGWLHPLDDQFPPWGPSRDWNVVCDVDAARTVLAQAGDLTCSTIPGTIRAQLREKDLARLRASGPLGRLLARQSLAHGAENRLHQLAAQHRGLHPDLVNFHWDPVACAAATGWEGVDVQEVCVKAVSQHGTLRLVPSAVGRRTKVVTDVDPDAFTDRWLAAVDAAQTRSRSRRALL